MVKKQNKNKVTKITKGYLSAKSYMNEFTLLNPKLKIENLQRIPQKGYSFTFSSTSPVNIIQRIIDINNGFVNVYKYNKPLVSQLSSSQCADPIPANDYYLCSNLTCPSGFSYCFNETTGTCSCAYGSESLSVYNPYNLAYRKAIKNNSTMTYEVDADSYAMVMMGSVFSS